MDGSKFTKPDYKVISSSYVAVFIAGNDIKYCSKEELEERKNWHDMMIHLLNAFEKWPNDMENVGWEAAEMWISNSILDKNIRDVSVHISNNQHVACWRCQRGLMCPYGPLFRKPGDRIKTYAHVHLIFLWFYDLCEKLHYP